MSINKIDESYLFDISPKFIFSYFLHLGTICSALLDRTKAFDPQPLSDVVRLITALMDNPEQGHVVDAGKHFDNVL